MFEKILDIFIFAFFGGIFGFLFWLLHHGRSDNNTRDELDEVGKSVEDAGNRTDSIKDGIEELSDTITESIATGDRLADGTKSMQDIISDSRKIIEEIRNQKSDN